MKKITRLFLSLIVTIVFASCTTTKDIYMFRELQEDYNQYNIRQEAPQHKIRPFDNLYLSVLTLDSEVNQLFNPSISGDGYRAGTAQMYGTPSSAYINGYMVSADSIVTLPILGELNLVNLSLEEAEDKLRRIAEEYLVEPTVQVKLLNYKVNVLGEVQNPGIYFSYEGSINILDAISMANGITNYADLNKVVLKRPYGERIVTHKINLTDNSIFSSEYFYLQPNDLIYIPPSKLKRNRENTSTYSLLLGTLSILMIAINLMINN